jgi:FtsH-binding integral membrane protein
MAVDKALDKSFEQIILELKKADGASLTEIIIGTALVLFTIAVIYKKTYHDGTKPPTCDDYVYNTFLYVILGLLLVITLCMVNDKLPILPDITRLIQLSSNLFVILIMMILMVIIMGVFMYLTKTSDPTNLIRIHAYWGIFVYLLASILYFLYIISRYMNVFQIGILITAIIVGITIYIGYTYPTLITPETRNILIGVLIVTIIIGIGSVFFVKDPKTLGIIMTIITVISLLLFIAFLLMEVGKVRENSKTCVVPNYPGESVLIIYDIIIIFKNILSLLTGRGRKRKF